MKDRANIWDVAWWQLVAFVIAVNVFTDVVRWLSERH
jgi:hypothetical protein